MSEANTLQSQLVGSVEVVRRWRAETELEVVRQVKEIDEEEERLQASIAELQRQLKAVAGMRGGIQSQLDQLDDEELERMRDAVLAGLTAEGALLEERALKYDLATNARHSSLSVLLGDPEVSALVDEYKQFMEAEPTLDLLPAGYRKAVLAHHEVVKSKLRPVFSAADAEAEPIDAAAAAFTVLASLDPEDGPTNALMVIVPVPFDVHSRWSERSEDLYALIAYRIVGAVSFALASIDAGSAQIQFAPYEGRLAIQVWLGDLGKADVRSAVENAIALVAASAAELAVVRLSPQVLWLPADAIISDEEEEEDDEDDLDDDLEDDAEEED